METLEDVLSHVERLIGNEGLGAEIVIQEEEGHLEMYDTGTRTEEIQWGSDFVSQPIYEQGWVVDTHEKRGPDTKKQESSRQELQPIYDSSEWYSARYLSGRELKVPEEILHNNVIDWTGLLKKDIVVQNSEKGLEKDLNAEIVVQEETGHTETHEGYGGWFGGKTGNTYEPSGTIIDGYVVDQPRIAHPDTEKRETARNELTRIYEARTKARTDLKKLYDLSAPKLGSDERRNIGNILGRDALSILEDELTFNGSLSKEELKYLYKRSNNQSARMNAGKQLDYSNLKIWAHEHPIAATLSGIATAGAASSLGYMIYHYLSK